MSFTPFDDIRMLDNTEEESKQIGVGGRVKIECGWLRYVNKRAVTTATDMQYENQDAFDAAAAHGNFVQSH